MCFEFLDGAGDLFEEEHDAWPPLGSDGVVDGYDGSGLHGFDGVPSGPSRDRLVKALLEEAQRRPPNIPPLPEAFRHYRRELGAQVYGAMGITREDKAGHDAAVLRNWEFFRAPLAGIVCMHRDLGLVDALGVGMYLQTLLLALTARGLGTCVEVSIAGYPEIVRVHLAIPAELSILCGLAVGYPDPDFPANKLHVGREAIEKNVVFVDN